MKNNKSIIRAFSAFFLAVALLMIAPIAAANGSDPADVGNVTQEITSMPVKITGEDKEYAHYWFSQIFGDFIFAPWDSNYESSKNITLLAKAIGFTNVLAIVLGLVIVYYVMLGGAMNTAHSGEVLGKQWSSIWIPIRTATGFSLIMPISTVGGGVLSFAQMFILWVIILGSNAATVLWNKSIDHLLDPNQNSILMVVGVKPSTDIFDTLICTENYIRHDLKDNRWTWDSGSTTQDELLVATVVKNESKRAGRSVVNQTVSHIYTSDLPTGTSLVAAASGQIVSAIKDPATKVIKFASGGDCGSIQFAESLEAYSLDDRTLNVGYKKQIVNDAGKAARQSVATLVQGQIEIIKEVGANSKFLNSLKQDLEAGKPASESSYVAKYLPLREKFYVITKNFASQLNNDIHTNVINNPTLQTKWKEDIKKGGWGKAGVWFYEINSIEAMSRASMDAFLSGVNFGDPTLCSPSFSWIMGDGCESTLEDYSAGQALSGWFYDYADKKADEQAFVPLIVPGNGSIGKCRTGDACGVESDSLEVMGMGLSRTIINILADGTPAGSNDPGEAAQGNRNYLTNSFQTVSSIGHSLNTAAATAWALGAGLSAVLEFKFQATQVGGPTKVLGPFAAAAKAIGNWVVMSLVMFALTLFSTGFVLAFLIPFLPIITWIIMVTGYLITVVEAVIAAPLAIILMVTPEGEGIAGTRLERAMQLLSMAVLKPSLMIIGLIASVTISGVSFGIMNEFFFLTAEHVLTSSIFNFVAIIVLYTMTAFQLSKLLISIMHKLPDQILDWFSSGVGRSFGENDIGGLVESGASEVKSAMGQQANLVEGGIKEKLRDAKRSQLYGNGNKGQSDA